MKKTFWGLLASFTAIFLSVISVTAVDIWRISPFRSYARTSRCDAGCLASTDPDGSECLVQGVARTC